MVEEIGIERVEQLARAGAQLVEVLLAPEYEEIHLPGALNIPLKKLDRDAASRLDRDRPVITYCWDSL